MRNTMKTHLIISILITILIPISLLGMDDNSPREPQEKKVRTDEQETIVPRPPELAWPLELLPNAPEQRASTAAVRRGKLLEVVKSGKSEYVERLLQAGGAANAEYHGRSLIHWAIEGARLLYFNGPASEEDEQEIKKKCALLKKYGADMNARMKDRYNGSIDQMTPLLYAALKGFTGICETLIELGALINLKAGVNEGTALHVAVYAGRLSTCELLLKRGADVNAIDRNGCRPLDLSIGGEVQRNGHMYVRDPNIMAQIRELLITYGADHKNHFIGFRKAVMAGDVDECRVLLEKGAELEKQGGCSFETPLFCAVRCGRFDVAKLLLEHRAQPTTRDAYNATPLHEAAKQGRTDLSNLLLDAGADMEASASDVVQETPLIHAVLEGADPLRIAMCRSLIKRGANPIISMDGNGRTLLSLIACNYNNLFITAEESHSFCLELMEMNCDPNVGNDPHTGNSALSDILECCSHESPVYKKALEMAVLVPRNRKNDIPRVRDGFLRIYCSLLVLNKRLRLPRDVVHQILVSNTELATDLFKLLLLNVADDAYYKTPYALRKPLFQIPLVFHKMIFQEIYRATINYLKGLVEGQPSAIEEEFGEKIKQSVQVRVFGCSMPAFE